MRSSEECVVAAPAKVNLVLRVLDRRPDGYHNVWSLMQTVGLEDELRVRLNHESGQVTVHCDDRQVPTDARNLVHRAITQVCGAAGRHVGVHVDLSKRVPVGGGLGGGSSDAAAVIVALNRLLGLKWSVVDMIRIGADLGSDVPFFFHAPAAIVRGRGEDIVPVRLSGRRWIVLVNPGFPVQTHWAYERLSQMRSGIVPLSQDLLGLVRHSMLTWEDVVPLMENDFEEALKSSHPALGEIKQALLDSGAEAALLSGSGATVFGIFRQERTAAQASDALSGRADYRVHLAPTAAGSSFSLEDAAFASDARG